MRDFGLCAHWLLVFILAGCMKKVMYEKVSVVCIHELCGVGYFELLCYSKKNGGLSRHLPVTEK